MVFLIRWCCLLIGFFFWNVLRGHVLVAGGTRILGKLDRGFAAVRGLTYFDAQWSFWEIKKSVVIREGGFVAVLRMVL